MLEIDNDNGTFDKIEIEDSSKIDAAVKAYCRKRHLPKASRQKIKDLILRNIEEQRESNIPQVMPPKSESNYLGDQGWDNAIQNEEDLPNLSSRRQHETT